ncbi:MAG TPA: hypothetical protein VJ932_04815 [Alkalispirochaeta sp.]|nr:hypothetical protein [Alkalispirochaeta sp.]
MDQRRDVADDRRKYLNDLEMIRGLMARYEEQSLVRPWVFGVWGVLVILGTRISMQMSQSGSDTTRVLLIVWVPVLLVSGVLEALGWILQNRQSGSAIFTRRMNRLIATYGGIIAIVAIMVLDMVPTGLSGAVVLALGALPLLAYAQMTFSSLYVEAFALLVAGIGVDMWLSDTSGMTGIAGVVVGVLYIVCGVHTRIEERRVVGGAADSGDDG